MRVPEGTLTANAAACAADGKPNTSKPFCPETPAPRCPPPVNAAQSGLVTGVRPSGCAGTPRASPAGTRRGCLKPGLAHQQPSYDGFSLFSLETHKNLLLPFRCSVRIM